MPVKGAATMSIKIMAAVWELNLPQNQKLVLLALADHADDRGTCYPSVARIAFLLCSIHRHFGKVRAHHCRPKQQVVEKIFQETGMAANLTRNRRGRQCVSSAF
jgi:hypothetical protein